MAEVFKSTEAGETTQHFVQFLMMYHQQTLLALGRHPNPAPHAPPPNLPLAKAFIQHLGAIQERTRGNLSAEEQNVLASTVSSLQGQYQEVTRS